MLLALIKFNLACVELRSLSLESFPENVLKIDWKWRCFSWFSLVGVTKIKCDHDSLEVE